MVGRGFTSRFGDSPPARLPRAPWRASRAPSSRPPFIGKQESQKKTKRKSEFTATVRVAVRAELCTESDDGWLGTAYFILRVRSFPFRGAQWSLTKSAFTTQMTRVLTSPCARPRCTRYASRLASRPAVRVALALNRDVAGLHRAASMSPRHAYPARRGGRPARHLRAAFSPGVVFSNRSSADLTQESQVRKISVNIFGRKSELQVHDLN